MVSSIIDADKLNNAKFVETKKENDLRYLIARANSYIRAVRAELDSIEEIVKELEELQRCH